MKPITLHAHEIHRLLSAGSALLVRPEPKQPPDWCVGVTVDPQGRANWFGPMYGSWPLEIADSVPYLRCPAGAPGAARWCRETWQGYLAGTWGDHADRVCIDPGGEQIALLYQADGAAPAVGDGAAPAGDGRSLWHDGDTWRSPVTMPRWASRMSVTVRSVAVKRVGEIDDIDARDAGFVESDNPDPSPPVQFAQWWDARYGKQYPWPEAWCWLIAVERTAAQRRLNDGSSHL